MQQDDMAGRCVRTIYFVLLLCGTVFGQFGGSPLYGGFQNMKCSSTNSYYPRCFGAIKGTGKCYGPDGYNPTTGGWCCNGESISANPYSRYGPPQQRYPPQRYPPQRGNSYPPSLYACCGSWLVKRTECICCRNDPFMKGRPNAPLKCCDKNPMNPRTQICCEGDVCPKLGGRPTYCCNKRSYSPPNQCCGQDIKPPQVARYDLSCDVNNIAVTSFEPRLLGQPRPPTGPWQPPPPPPRHPLHSPHQPLGPGVRPPTPGFSHQPPAQTGPIPFRGTGPQSGPFNMNQQQQPPPAPGTQFKSNNPPQQMPPSPAVNPDPVAPQGSTKPPEGAIAGGAAEGAAGQPSNNNNNPPPFPPPMSGGSPAQQQTQPGGFQPPPPPYVPSPPQFNAHQPPPQPTPPAGQRLSPAMLQKLLFNLFQGMRRPAPSPVGR